jgi:succinoglycan biosynthesis protein ExoA
VKVAVVVPARNAGSLLTDCLAAILRQTRPADEILLVIGPSDDDTAQVAARLSGAMVGVLDNPAGDRGSALNAALEATGADILAFVDAQAIVAPDYVERAMESLEKTGAAVVGGPMRPTGRTLVGRAMALALRTAFGSGGSQFHFEGGAREAESVYLGVYRATAFSRVGGYNPALLRTEDDDLNWRVRNAGMKIWLDPSIQSTYQARDTLAAIWRQYHGYGYWKVALATLRPGAIRPRHLVPAAFVLALVAAALVSFLAWSPALPLLLGLYLLAALGAAVLAPDAPLGVRLLYPLVTLTMHLAYGIGTLQGLVAWRRLRARVRAGARRADEATAERERDLAKIRHTYDTYESGERTRLWDPRNPGYARLSRDRDAALVELLRRSLPPAGSLLDLGCGTGDLAESARRAGLEPAWTGLDLRGSAVAEAAARFPWARFVEGSADALPFDNASFDVVVASTLFSSLPSSQLETAAAAEIARVLRPGGWLVWYDLRYDNPRNPDVHGIDRKRLAELFPAWLMEVRSSTLLPPLARRLGPLTPALYPLLQALPPLRSHLVGRLQRPPA